MASVKFSAEANTKGATARLNKAINKIIKQGFVAATDIKNMGKEYARAVVPKGEHGWLYKTIQGEVTQTAKGTQARIFLSPTTGVPQSSAGKYKGNFDLALWMHRTKGYGLPVYQNSNGDWYTAKHGARKKRHLSGSPTFMYDTRNYLKTAGVAKIKKDYKNIVANL